MAEAQGFEETVIERINQMVDPMADAAAGLMGMPPGGKRYTQAEIDNEWNFSPLADPKTRAETMLALKQLGKSDEEITDAVYPKRRRLITTGRPKIADQLSFAKAQANRMAKLAVEMGMFPAPTDRPAEVQAQPDRAVGGTDPAPTMPPPAAPAPVPPVAPAPSPLDAPFMSMMGG